MDRTYLEEVSEQHYKASIEMEPSRKKEERMPKEHLVERCRVRNENVEQVLEPTRGNSNGQKQMEGGNHQWPMLHWELRAYVSKYPSCKRD